VQRHDDLRWLTRVTGPRRASGRSRSTR
jgi:hypothetical protein